MEGPRQQGSFVQMVTPGPRPTVHFGTTCTDQGWNPAMGTSPHRPYASTCVRSLRRALTKKARAGSGASQGDTIPKGHVQSLLTAGSPPAVVSVNPPGRFGAPNPGGECRIDRFGSPLPVPGSPRRK